ALHHSVAALRRGAAVGGVSQPLRHGSPRRPARAGRAGAAWPRSASPGAAAPDGGGRRAFRRARPLAVLRCRAGPGGGLRGALNRPTLSRGPLASGNCGGGYCPFAKHAETPAELDADRRALERFTDWVARRGDGRVGVLFTPWGEALIRRWYQEALVRLTR